MRGYRVRTVTITNVLDSIVSKFDLVTMGEHIQPSPILMVLDSEPVKDGSDSHSGDGALSPPCASLAALIARAFRIVYIY